MGLRHHLRPRAGQFPVGQIVRTYMTMADVCAEFGVSQGTGSAKARAISDALKLGPAFDPEYGRCRACWTGIRWSGWPR